jgi:hypothetical protein
MYNNISSFTNKLHRFYDCTMPILVGRIDLKGNLVHHFMDMITGFGYTGVHDTRLLCLFRQSFAIDFYDNQLICDCVDYAVYEAIKGMRCIESISNMYCSAPPALYGTKVAVLVDHMEVFVCDISDDCPVGCKCTNQPSSRSVIIACSGQNMTEIPKHIPPMSKFYVGGYSYSLDFSNNNLSTLDSARDYYNVSSVIRLNDNNIDKIDINALKAMTGSLTIIYLHNNVLTSLPSEIRSMSFKSLKEIHLYNNPWSCDCHALWMKRWLLSLGSVAFDVNLIMCHNDDIRGGRGMVGLDDGSFVCGRLLSTNEALQIAVPTVIAFFLTVVSACVTVLYAKRKWLYSEFRLHPFDIDECYGEKMTYDLFVSGANDDDDKIDSVVKFLNNRGY